MTITTLNENEIRFEDEDGNETGTLLGFQEVDDKVYAILYNSEVAGNEIWKELIKED